MFNALSLKCFGKYVGTGGQRCVNVAARIRAGTQHIIFGLPHGNFIGVQRNIDIGDRGVHFVIHRDECGCCARCLARVGDHNGQHITGIRRDAPDRNHHWPVFVDDANHEFTRNVCSGKHRMHSIRSASSLSVNVFHGRSGVARKVQRGMQHARHTNVVDIATVAQGQRVGFVFGRARTNASYKWHLRNVAERYIFDGFKNFGVPRATAQVSTQVTSHVATFQCCTFFVDLGLGSHHDAGNTKTTLQPAASGKCLGKHAPFGFVYAFESGDGLACGFFHAGLTRHHCFAVNQYGAAPALTRGRTAVFGRCDVEFLTQRRQEVGVGATHHHRGAVDDEVSHLYSLSSSGRICHGYC